MLDTINMTAIIVVPLIIAAAGVIATAIIMRKAKQICDDSPLTDLED